MLLEARNRLAEAEPLMRHALAIDEKTLGAQDPDVALDLYNLATLIPRSRVAEAEPLMRRALMIFLDFARRMGYEHPYQRVVSDGYRRVLQAMGRTDAEIERLIEYPHGM